MSDRAHDALVTTGWLAEHLGDDDVRVVDGSWHLPAAKRDARAEFAAGHVPGAVFFDIDAIADGDTSLPHMLPSPEKFARAVGALGIGDGDRVVVYDASAMRSAARVWWTFRAFGHDDVAVLDGGLAKWRAEGRPITAAAPSPIGRRFTARLRASLVRDLEAVRANLGSRVAQVVDARSPGRFVGAEPEPRPGVRGGHIPGSVNLPFDRLYAADGTLLPAPSLRDAFAKAGVDLGRPAITTCGSGVTAAGLALGLHVLGHPDVAVYDGSWTEWGGRDDTPIERG
jgi:thiosulfate/3-mercaptopyruvate sulfurtransferase